MSNINPRKWGRFPWLQSKELLSVSQVADMERATLDAWLFNNTKSLTVDNNGYHVPYTLKKYFVEFEKKE